MNLGTRAAVFLVLASPVALHAQKTGTSKPEDIPVTTSPDGISQPVVYENAVAPALKTRVAAAAEVAPAPVLTATAPAPTFVVVGPVAPLAKAEGKAEMVTPDDPDAEIVTRIPGPANQLPVGTFFKVELHEKISTSTATAGKAFRAELTEDVLRDGRTFLPAGSIVQGSITEVHNGKRSSGPAALHFEPTSVVLPDGTTYPLRAQVIDTSRYRQTHVDSEGTILRSDHPKSTAAVFALSTGSGAAAGAIFGGWPGALIGGAVGAGVSTVTWLRQDHSTDLPAGTTLTLSLTRPITIGKE